MCVCVCVSWVHKYACGRWQIGWEGEQLRGWLPKKLLIAQLYRIGSGFLWEAGLILEEILPKYSYNQCLYIRNKSCFTIQYTLMTHSKYFALTKKPLSSFVIVHIQSINYSVPNLVLWATLWSMLPMEQENKTIKIVLVQNLCYIINL